MGIIDYEKIEWDADTDIDEENLDHMDQGIADLANAMRTYVGSYEGTASSGRLIELPFRPLFVIVQSFSPHFLSLSSIGGISNTGWRIRQNLNPATANDDAYVPGLVSSGFTVAYDGTVNSLDRPGATYRFIAFGMFGED